MVSLNKVMIMGNLTRDPEMLKHDMPIAKFGMAINQKIGDKEKVCFVDLTAFGINAQLISKHLKKGSPLFVEGRLDFSSWETAEGLKKNKLEVIVDRFQFIGSPRKSDDQDSESPE